MHTILDLFDLVFIIHVFWDLRRDDCFLSFVEDEVGRGKGL